MLDPEATQGKQSSRENRAIACREDDGYWYGGCTSADWSGQEVRLRRAQISLAQADGEDDTWGYARC